MLLFVIEGIKRRHELRLCRRHLPPQRDSLWFANMMNDDCTMILRLYRPYDANSKFATPFKIDEHFRSLSLSHSVPMLRIAFYKRLAILS